jgi:hypothetical protein
MWRMSKEVIDREMACALQADARRTWHIVGWIIVENDPDHPGQFAARLLSGEPSPYVLLDHSLNGLRAQLPSGLKRLRSKPQGAVEIWFAL